MKALKLIAVALLMSTWSFGQIKGISDTAKEFEVGKLKTGTKFMASIAGRPGEKDTTYVLSFQHEKSPTVAIKKISFSSKDNTLEKFHNAFLPFWKDENQDNKDFKSEFKLGGKPISLTVVSTVGGNRVRVAADGGSFVINKEQVEKLFGKK